MPLTVSCDALYFPPGEAVDNVLTIKWVQDEPLSRGSKLGPSSMVLFKLKCTSPALFHVVPRYGVLPLVDGKGVMLEEAVTATVTIGLHPSALQECTTNTSHANLGSAVNGNVSPVSTTNSTATNTTTRRVSAERFAVVYCVIQNQPVSYGEVMQALPGNGSSANADVAHKLWSFIAQKMLGEEYVGPTRSITLKVYTENVVLPRQGMSTPPAGERGAESARNNSGGRGAVVVSASARLVESSLARRLKRPYATPPGTGDDGAPIDLSQSVSRAGKIVDSPTPPQTRVEHHERKSLETEIHLLKSEAASSSSVNLTRSLQDAASPPTRSVPSTSTQPSSSTTVSRRPLLADDTAASCSEGGTPPVKPRTTTEGTDLLMHLNGAEEGGAASWLVGRQRGVKVYMLLLLMFAVYVLALLCRPRAVGGHADAVRYVQSA